MGALVNRQVRLVSRPRGIPQAEHFALATEPMPAPGKGEDTGQEPLPLRRSGPTRMGQ
jgi:NADPH-dependent curcumin reductase CurA